MEFYCTASHCPLANSCNRLKQQTATTMDNYSSYVDKIRATLNGFECEMFQHIHIGQQSITWTTTKT